MKYFLYLTLIIALASTVTGCVEKGGIADISKIQQADRAMKLVRNALEDYYIDHDTYPPEGVCLRELLIPYMPMIKTADGDSISKWDKEVEPAFSEGPAYSTQNQKINYFVRARANDTNKTPISIRPSLIREEEEDNKKKEK